MIADHCIPVSVIVMTRNEEKNIAACLAGLDDFAEVFVVDSGSDDETQSLARSSGATVVHFQWNGRYPKKKQWCLDNLSFNHRHVLFVDADERVRPMLAREIRSAVADDQHAGWFVGLEYVWLGRVLHYGATMYKLALFDRHRARFVEWDDLDATRMWEVEGHYQPVVSGPTTTLAARLLHDDHDRLYDWFERHNRYSDWEAVVRINGGSTKAGETQARWRRILKRAFGLLPGKPYIVLAHALVLRAGWRDGWPGVQFAIAKAIYQWQIDLKVSEIRRRGLEDAP